MTTAIEAYSIPASSAAAAGASSASSRAVGAAGVASTTASASTRSGRSSGRPRSAKPVSVRRSSRTVAPVRTSSPRGQRLGEPGQAAGQPGEDRHVARRAARRRAAAPAAARRPAGHRRPRREQPGVAGVHPAEQRLDQPVDHLVAEPAGDQVADRDVVADRAPGLLVLDPGQALLGQHARTRAARRGRAARPSASAAAAAARRGSRSATTAPRGARPPARARGPGRRPRAAGSASPRRRRRRATPPTSARRSLPPASGAASSTVTSSPRRQEVRRGQPGDPAPDHHDRTHPASQTVGRQTSHRPDRVLVGTERGLGGSGGLGQPAEAAAVEDQRQRGVASTVTVSTACSWSSTIVWSPASTSR